MTADSDADLDSMEHTCTYSYNYNYMQSREHTILQSTHVHCTMYVCMYVCCMYYSVCVTKGISVSLFS